MSRMIDAEPLKELFPDNGEGSWTYNATVKAYIDAQPTVQPETNCSEIPNNSDTISRQQAIDALDKRFDNVPMEQTAEILGLRKDLRELPLAQPEIIRCKDCKFSHMTVGGECKYCDVWFPDEKTYVPGDYFCGSAKRRGETNE